MCVWPSRMAWVDYAPEVAEAGYSAGFHVPTPPLPSVGLRHKCEAET